MAELLVKELRGDIVESVHRVSVAVVSAQNDLVGAAGNPGLVTFMRSAAKPLQAMAFVESGAMDNLGVTQEELALSCASHNSERAQVEIARGFLKRIGLTETDLACGPHVSLFKDLGRYQGPDAARPDIVDPSPLANNCSGKHSAMLGYAKFMGWETGGYQESGHPVQRQCLKSVANWCDMKEEDVGRAVDGCTVVTFALPLRNMALSYARLISGASTAGTRIMNAMVSHPGLIAGSRRLCTALMQQYPGKIVAKVGAGGVYLAALVDEKVGIALKVEDGAAPAGEIALLEVVRGFGWSPDPVDALPAFSGQKIVNTRKEVVGTYEVTGQVAIS